MVGSRPLPALAAGGRAASTAGVGCRVPLPAGDERDQDSTRETPVAARFGMGDKFSSLLLLCWGGLCVLFLLLGHMGCWALLVYLGECVAFRCIRSVRSILCGNRDHRTNFGFSHLGTVQMTEFSVFGLFGFGLGSFGSVVRSSVNMPTPTGGRIPLGALHSCFPFCLIFFL